MFTTNSPYHGANRPAKPVSQSTNRISKLPQPSKKQFADLVEFSNWIDNQLEQLELLYVDYETQASRRNHFKR